MDHHLEPGETGAAVLNIGGDIGAAVVRTPALLAGSELEIRRRGAPWDGTHTAVRARLLPDGPVHAALFDTLAEGRYEVRVRNGGGDIVDLDVEGGRVIYVVLDPQDCQ